MYTNSNEFSSAALEQTASMRSLNQAEVMMVSGGLSIFPFPFPLPMPIPLPRPLPKPWPRPIPIPFPRIPMI